MSFIDSEYVDDFGPERKLKTSLSMLSDYGRKTTTDVNKIMPSTSQELLLKESSAFEILRIIVVPKVIILKQWNRLPAGAFNKRTKNDLWVVEAHFMKNVEVYVMNIYNIHP